MIEEYEEEREESNEESPVVYSTNDVIVQEILDGEKITPIHERILHSILEQTENMPNQIIKETREDIEKMHYDLSIYANVLLDSVHALYKDPHNFNPKKIAIKNKINYDIDSKRVILCYDLMNIVKSQQTLIWELVPRQRAIKRYVDHLLEENKIQEEQIEQLKETIKEMKEVQKEKKKKKAK